MKIAIYYKGIKKGTSEWGNWEMAMKNLANDNPDIEWEMIEDDEEFSG